MNGDLSLSQTLGGLRIANPDAHEASPSPPPSAPPASDRSPPFAYPLPPSSSHSSASTVTEHSRVPQLQQLQLSDSSSSFGFDPSQYSASAARTSPEQLISQTYSSAPYAPTTASPHGQYSTRQPPYDLPPVNYPPQSQHSVSRPPSGPYHHGNISSSSMHSNSSYRYGDDSLGAVVTPPLPPTQAGSVRRSDSRVLAAKAAAAAMNGGLSRDPSRTYRQPAQQMIEGNGPAPPRRSSRRIPNPSMGGAPLPNMSPPGDPYGGEGGPIPSSEEWKERGAAIGIKKEIDANGRTVQKVMKKGVKDFNFGRTLGEGSYSTVLAATDRTNGREYAIKVLDKRHIIKEKKVKYVNIEKDTLNRLTEHPGIVRLYYTFQDERSLYFVLDLASGGELLGVLKKYGTFDVECSRFYGAQILDSIEYMHIRGVIHRDLKPENVLLDSNMHVKITDFGTAKILENRSHGGSNVLEGNPLEGAQSDRAVSFVGTAEYVSPELLTDKNACKASDLWAFGCIIYQLLAGRPPFKAGNEYQTFQKIVALDYTFPDGFPEVARDLVERLLVLDPAKRLPIEHIKNHRFFDGMLWGKGLWKQKGPRLRPYKPPEREAIRLNGPNISVPSTNAGSTSIAQQPSQRPTPQPRLITELPPPSQLDIDWSPVLTRTNERILKLGNLTVTSQPQAHSPTGIKGNDEAPKKFSRFFGGNTMKKKQRLVMITNSARVILAAAGGDEKKAKTELSLLAAGTSWRSVKDGRGITCWCIDTRDRHYAFEDPRASPSDAAYSEHICHEWLDTLAQAKDFALSQSLTQSYSGASTLDDLSSTLSSPTSTLEDTAIDGVNIPTTRNLISRRDRGETDDGSSLSGKGRKRFSRRHSKNGLAAVF